MVQIANVDYDAKRAYLHLDTVSSGFDVILAYFEINVLREANANSEQNRAHLMSAEGNIQKTTTTYTPRFGLIEPGWRFVPYDTAHKLVLKAEIVSKDQLTDKDVFDRTGVTSNVDIDKDYKEVEIREISSGSGLSEAQDAILTAIGVQSEDLHQFKGLDVSNPIARGGDGVTMETLTVDGKVLTFTPTTISRS